MATFMEGFAKHVERGLQRYPDEFYISCTITNIKPYLYTFLGPLQEVNLNINYRSYIIALNNMAKAEYSLAEGVEVDVFGRPRCGDCDEAKKAIEEVQVPYTYTNVVGDLKAQEKFKRICEALEMEPAVPVIVISTLTENENSKLVFVGTGRLILTCKSSLALH